MKILILQLVCYFKTMFGLLKNLQIIFLMNTAVPQVRFKQTKES